MLLVFPFPLWISIYAIGCLIVSVSLILNRTLVYRNHSLYLAKIVRTVYTPPFSYPTCGNILCNVYVVVNHTWVFRKQSLYCAKIGVTSAYIPLSRPTCGNTRGMLLLSLIVHTCSFLEVMPFNCIPSVQMLWRCLTVYDIFVTIKTCH